MPTHKTRDLSGTELRAARRKEALAAARAKKDLPLEEHAAQSSEEPNLTRRKAKSNPLWKAAHAFKRRANANSAWCAGLVDLSGRIDSINGNAGLTDITVLSSHLRTAQLSKGWSDQHLLDLVEHFWVMVDQGEIKVTTAIRDGVPPWRVFVSKLARVDSSLAKQEDIIKQLGGRAAVRDKLREALG